MSTDELLRTLGERGVELYLDGDCLRYLAPEGALTPELRGDVGVHRPAIIERLKSAAATSIGEHGEGKSPRPVSPPSSVSEGLAGDGTESRRQNDPNGRRGNELIPARRAKRCNLCKPDDWLEERDPGRSGWIRTTCGRCGRFIGYRPRDV